jgi:low temperature requirement protein LtrA
VTIPLRPMRARDMNEEHRASTELELFFDLVIVIAIASLTAAFHYAISSNKGLEMLPNFIFLFLALWWAWMNFTWFASAFDNDDALYRLLVLTIMVGALIFAGGIAYIFKTLNFSFGIFGWIIMRIGMVALWLRAARHTPKLRKTCYRYATGLLLAQVIWILVAFNVTPASLAFYIFGCLAFLVEWSVPVWAERAGRTPWHRHHMMERYGLMTIIVLGEVLLSIALTFGGLFDGSVDLDLIKIGLAALIIVFGFWWIYFAETHHLSTIDFGRTFVWGYGHVFIFSSIAVMGAGLAAYFDLMTDHSTASAAAVGWFIGGPLAIALLSLWLVRDRYIALGPRAPALPVGAAAILLATALQSEPFVYAALTLAILIWRVPFSNTEGQHP